MTTDRHISVVLRRALQSSTFPYLNDVISIDHPWAIVATAGGCLCIFSFLVFCCYIRIFRNRQQRPANEQPQQATPKQRTTINNVTTTTNAHDVENQLETGTTATKKNDITEKRKKLLQQMSARESVPSALAGRRHSHADKNTRVMLHRHDGDAAGDDSDADTDVGRQVKHIKQEKDSEKGEEEEEEDDDEKSGDEKSGDEGEEGEKASATHTNTNHAANKESSSQNSIPPSAITQQQKTLSSSSSTTLSSPLHPTSQSLKDQTETSQHTNTHPPTTTSTTNTTTTANAQSTLPLSSSLNTADADAVSVSHHTLTPKKTSTVIETITIGTPTAPTPVAQSNPQSNFQSNDLIPSTKTNTPPSTTPTSPTDQHHHHQLDHQLEHLEQLLSTNRQTLGDQHPHTLSAMNNLAGTSYAYTPPYSYTLHIPFTYPSHLLTYLLTHSSSTSHPILHTL